MNQRQQILDLRSRHFTAGELMNSLPARSRNINSPINSRMPKTIDVERGQESLASLRFPDPSQPTSTFNWKLLCGCYGFGHAGMGERKWSSRPGMKEYLWLF